MKSKKAKKALAYFLIFLFIGSMISRGVYAALLPRVETENPTYRNLVHKVVVYGELSAKREVAVYGESGLRIDRIFVKEGERVEAGEALLQYDLKDLDKILSGMKTDVEKLNIQLETMNYNRSLTVQAKDRERKRAGEDLLKTEQRSLEDAAAAAEKVNKARSALEGYPEKAAYIEEMCRQDAKYQEMAAKVAELEAAVAAVQSVNMTADVPDAIQMDIKLQQEMQNGNAESASALSDNVTENTTQDIDSLSKELSEERNALEAYKKTLEDSFGTQWEEQRQLLSDAVKDQEAAASIVGRQNEDSLKSAKRTVEDAMAGLAKDSSPELLALELKSMQDEIAWYEKMRSQDGILTSEYTGMVTKLLVGESDRIPDGAVCRIADAAEGYYFEGEVTKKEREFLTVGDRAKLSVGTGNESAAVKITSIKEKADKESYIVTFEAEKDAESTGTGQSIEISGNIGDIGMAEVEKQEERSCISVPISAIREERGTKYVLVAEERQSILGTVQVATRKNVDVLSFNASYAALSGSGLSKDDKVIINSTKPVMQGSKLRLLSP